MIAPPPSGIQRHTVRSSHLGGNRTIDIWLPPEYHENAWARYPVVYLLDGQNVFDGKTSFIPGKTWCADETATRCVRQRKVRPCIQVAIWNGGSRRIDEYTAVRDQRHGGGGALRHTRFLFDELFPWVGQRYRVRARREDTALVGASLGGLYVLDLICDHSDRVGGVGAMSPSVWWNQRSILQRLSRLRPNARPRIWLDIGTREGVAAVRDFRDCAAVLTDSGWQAGVDLAIREEDGAGHDEAAWAGRYGECLTHLLPSRTRVPN